MPKLKLYLKRIALGMPIATIVIASFFPLQTGGQQALVLFILIWFYIFILFDVLGK